MSDITQLHRALVARVIDGDGTAPPELRRAAFDKPASASRCVR
ncbi:hypothetical protein C8K38_101349 [Rhodococcus sp. OK611]|nr:MULTISPECIES: hypothetical protein [unclassified Rhodococcus (in: high G+C Gram-positive bacteria)]PTR45620.1 hypothetical protein C8K38_101349 [Rhodococcus sp. OK611]SNX89170.1 hypothetical protein SAMN05447004_101349 [Rhodococcus sp. OK270]